MNVREMHECNRVGWNEGAEHYATLVARDIEFLRSGGTNFVAPEYAYLQNLKDWCGRAIHLQCAGGRDTLSLWNLGAQEVIGVDISDRMLECAREKSEALQAPARWIRADVLDTPHDLDGTADLVYTGRGALCWLQDLDAWARVPARLLKPGGQFYLFEGHPLAWVWDQEKEQLALDPQYGDYFMTNVQTSQGWGETYIGDMGRPQAQHAVKYERQWTLGRIINALLAAGLRVERLEEHPETYFDSLPHLPPDVVRRLPNTFSLLMRKEES